METVNDVARKESLFRMFLCLLDSRLKDNGFSSSCSIELYSIDVNMKATVLLGVNGKKKELTMDISKVENCAKEEVRRIAQEIVSFEVKERVSA